METITETSNETYAFDTSPNCLPLTFSEDQDEFMYEPLEYEVLAKSDILVDSLAVSKSSIKKPVKIIAKTISMMIKSAVMNCQIPFCEVKTVITKSGNKYGIILKVSNCDLRLFDQTDIDPFTVSVQPTAGYQNNAIDFLADIRRIGATIAYAHGKHFDINVTAIYSKKLERKNIVNFLIDELEDLN